MLKLRRRVRHDHRELAFVAQLQDVPDAMDLRDQSGLAQRHPKTRSQPPCSQFILKRLDQSGNAGALARGDGDAAGKSAPVSPDQFVVRERIDFVEHHQRLFSERAQLLDHGADRFDVLVDPRMAEIDDMNQQIGFDHFLERGLE